MKNNRICEYCKINELDLLDSWRTCNKENGYHVNNNGRIHIKDDGEYKLFSVCDECYDADKKMWTEKRFKRGRDLRGWELKK